MNQIETTHDILGGRPTVRSMNGMVAAAHPLAANAGAEILRKGGNAFDAVAATAAALNVVEPFMSGLAGAGGATIFLAAESTVETIDFIGYSKEHGAYVFGDLAVAGGKVVPINSEDFFELGPRRQLKTLSQSVALHINPDRKAFSTEWTQQLLGAFGSRGVVALAYWMGSLLAEQIRAEMVERPN